MNPYVLIGALVALIGAVAVGFGVGRKIERSDWEQKELTRAEKVIVRYQTITKEVPKIVTKVVTKEVQVQKEAENVIQVIRRDLRDCVLPDNYSRLLIRSARAIDGEAPGEPDDSSGAYDCAEVLEATVRDLEAGRRNSARLAGLQEWANTVTQ